MSPCKIQRGRSASAKVETTSSSALGLIVLLLLSMVSASNVRAGEPTLEMAPAILQHWLKPAAVRLGQLANSNEQTVTDLNEATVCHETYGKILRDAQLNIHLGFGYMDVSDGKPFNYDGQVYPNAVAMDPSALRAMFQQLIAPCTGELRACEFRSIPGRPFAVSRTVTAPGGEMITVNVEMAGGAYSTSFAANTGVFAAQQAAQSALAEENFFAGIARADAVIYMGHSRNGGGPDFRPPILRGNGHADYAGYYRVQRPGLSRLIKVLQAQTSASELPSLVALLSCLSEHHFGVKLSSAAANAGLLFSDSSALFDYDDILQGGFATVDALMRFQCRSGFQLELNASSKATPRILMRQFLGSPRVTNPSPVPPDVAQHGT